jgi:hypothetical protein
MSGKASQVTWLQLRARLYLSIKSITGRRTATIRLKSSEVRYYAMKTDHFSNFLLIERGLVVEIWMVEKISK